MPVSKGRSAMIPAGIEGEILVVYMARDRNDPDRHPTVLKGPELVTIAGRSFIAGRLLAYPNYWASERRILLAVERVESIIEFESEQSYRDMRGSYRSGPEKGWRFLFWSGGKK